MALGIVMFVFLVSLLLEAKQADKLVTAKENSDDATYGRDKSCIAHLRIDRFTNRLYPNEESGKANDAKEDKPNYLCGSLKAWREHSFILSAPGPALTSTFPTNLQVRPRPGSVGGKAP